jgi:hypothetical protein
VSSIIRGWVTYLTCLLIYPLFSPTTVYEDIYDAKRAVDHLSGFNVGGRYLVVMYYQPAKFQRKADNEEKQRELQELRKQIAAKKAKMAAEGN